MNIKYELKVLYFKGKEKKKKRKDNSYKRKKINTNVCLISLYRLVLIN